jgi:3-oxoacyl-[acyl-carrier-protein] synthase-3
MAKISFNNVKISAIVTTVGDKKVLIDDEAENFGYTEKSLKRAKKSMGFNSRYIVSNPLICTSDLCYQSAIDIFENYDIDKKEIEALLFVSQTPDYKAPSTAIILQDRLKLSTNCIAYDINLGCSGLINGLFTAYSMINSGLKKILLCTGDISSQFAYKNDKNLTPLMGDAGSTILIERCEDSKSHFVLHSDGSGYRHLIIPTGGAREPFREDSLEPKKRENGSIRRDVDMYMNGGEIFNFTIKVVPTMFDELFKLANITKDDIDYFVLHQANRYILQNIAKRLEVGENKLPMSTVTTYGNQNSSSIAGTINGFLSKECSTKKSQVVFAGFGIGLSWGACIVEIDRIYAPEIKVFAKG